MKQDHKILKGYKNLGNTLSGDLLLVQEVSHHSVQLNWPWKIKWPRIIRIYEYYQEWSDCSPSLKKACIRKNWLNILSVRTTTIRNATILKIWNCLLQCNAQQLIKVWYSKRCPKKFGAEKNAFEKVILISRIVAKIANNKQTVNNDYKM